MGRINNAFDLNLSDEARGVLMPGLRACNFPFGRIVRRTGARVPISVSDTSRYNATAAEAGGHHGHVHDAAGNEAHVLASRKAALGLYWLPTPQHPAGRIEVGTNAMSDPDLAREVMLAEVAHAVDYGAMSDRQREKIMALFEHSHEGHEHRGWFEEHGERDYWAWRGERWMGLFMAAFAPSLPRPLEKEQPWHWDFDATDVRRARAILRRP